MSQKRVVLAMLCCALGLAGVPAGASASSARAIGCKLDINWAPSLTQVVATATNYTCYNAAAEEDLQVFFPEIHAYPQTSPGPYTTTYDYTPIVGRCLGQVSLDTPTTTTIGVLKNDGNFHSVVELVGLAKGAPAGSTLTLTAVGALQEACNPFNTTTVALGYEVFP